MTRISLLSIGLKDSLVCFFTHVLRENINHQVNRTSKHGMEIIYCFTEISSILDSLCRVAGENGLGTAGAILG